MNVSVELASYLTTMFDSSGALRVASSNVINDVQLIDLDNDLDFILKSHDLTLPELLTLVSIRLSYFTFFHIC